MPTRNRKHKSNPNSKCLIDSRRTLLTHRLRPTTRRALRLVARLDAQAFARERARVPVAVVAVLPLRGARRSRGCSRRSHLRDFSVERLLVLRGRLAVTRLTRRGRWPRAYRDIVVTITRLASVCSGRGRAPFRVFRRMTVAGVSGIVARWQADLLLWRRTAGHARREAGRSSVAGFPTATFTSWLANFGIVIFAIAGTHGSGSLLRPRPIKSIASTRRLGVLWRGSWRRKALVELRCPRRLLMSAATGVTRRHRRRTLHSRRNQFTRFMLQ